MTVEQRWMTAFTAISKHIFPAVYWTELPEPVSKGAPSHTRLCVFSAKSSSAGLVGQRHAFFCCIWNSRRRRTESVRESECNLGVRHRRWCSGHASVWRTAPLRVWAEGNQTGIICLCLGSYLNSVTLKRKLFAFFYFLNLIWDAGAGFQDSQFTRNMTTICRHGWPPCFCWSVIGSVKLLFAEQGRTANRC